jgi:hypothetical protein
MSLINILTYDKILYPNYFIAFEPLSACAFEPFNKIILI